MDEPAIVALERPRGDPRVEGPTARALPCGQRMNAAAGCAYHLPWIVGAGRPGVDCGHRSEDAFVSICGGTLGRSPRKERNDLVIARKTLGGT